MAAINYDLVRWSLKKWLGMVVGIALIHYVLLKYFSAPAPEPKQAHPMLPSVKIQPWSEMRAANSLVAVEDPLLFGGVHQFGFSGVAWVKKPRRNYALESRLPAVNYLEFNMAKAFFGEVPAPPSLTAPPVRRARLERREESEAKPDGKSELVLEGALAGHELMKRPELPIQRHNDAVGTTVVEAGVTTAGFVLSARVIKSSGSKKADQDALGIARGLRFKAQEIQIPEGLDAKVTWGKLKFEWFAVDLAGTNAPAKP